MALQKVIGNFFFSSTTSGGIKFLKKGKREDFQIQLNIVFKFTFIKVPAEFDHAIMAFKNVGQKLIFASLNSALIFLSLSFIEPSTEIYTGVNIKY